MKNGRILSYNLAHELSKDEINCVSGSGAKITVIVTQKWTSVIGGANDMSPDTSLD